MKTALSRPRCAGAGKVRCGVRSAGAVAGAVYVRARFYPHQWVTKYLWKFPKLHRTTQQAFQNRQGNSKRFCNERIFIWIFVHWIKSLLNYAHLIFRFPTTSRSRRFCGTWLHRVIHLSSFLALMIVFLNRKHPTHSAKYSFVFWKRSFIGGSFLVIKRCYKKIHPIKWYCTWSPFFVYQLFWVKISSCNKLIMSTKEMCFVLNNTLCWKKMNFCRSLKSAKVSFSSRTLTF